MLTTLAPPDLADSLPWTTPGVLVGVDGSTHSVTALSYANQLARTLGLPLHAVLAWDYPPPLYQDLAYPQVRTSVRAHAGERLRDAIDAVLDGDEPPWLTYDARQGAPAATLLALSRYARLLVVGTRGHGGFADLLLGSVSATCVSHAPCPVVVVPRTWRVESETS
ncbi:nucleotide-binding universal stress UspA family protein [Microbacterium sp. SORGH_AS 505]|uniref:universal stress protein n=1 Tax=Microbacterium sp. SORGH_AS_0505 TaxID=3041770 RepID=UPI0027846B24|nr:universal stress protein [Microbacterium sp. SORGH_AS_0505]MDQ1125682.1 nucleotide-binding universal stress UspA family protein [Microbacterium sp. SORGH_AS_0505]